MHTTTTDYPTPTLQTVKTYTTCILSLTLAHTHSHSHMHSHSLHSHHTPPLHHTQPSPLPTTPHTLHYSYHCTTLTLHSHTPLHYLPARTPLAASPKLFSPLHVSSAVSCLRLEDVQSSAELSWPPQLHRAISSAALPWVSPTTSPSLTTLHYPLPLSPAPHHLFSSSHTHTLYTHSPLHLHTHTTHSPLSHN